jgi:hypothetical protein
MNRKLKALGLALVAVLAMGALSASAASAENFHSESATDTVIKGSQVGQDVFVFNAGTVKCNEATYAGEQKGATATSVKVTPTYTECTAFGFVNTKIDSAQCTYEFSSDNNNVVISCPSAEPLTVTAFNCWVALHSQTLGGISYNNTGAGNSRDIDLGTNVTGISYSQHSKAFPGCNNNKTEQSYTNGTYTAGTTVQGFTTGGTQVGIWRS